MTTVSALLLGSAADQVEAAAKVSEKVQTPQIGQAVVRKVFEVLNFEIGDVLVEAWRTRSSLLNAAHETKAQPGVARRVTLRTYALPWEHAIEMEIRLGGKHIATVPVGLLLEIEVTALSAVIQSGMLTHLESGQYRATASLTICGVPVASRERFFDLRAEVKLGAGLPLTR